MRFLGLNIAVATWLLASAFFLPHTPTTLAATVAAAFLVALFAALALGRPGARFVITGIAVLLAAGALLVPDMPRASAISNGIVAAVLAVLSLVSPLSTHPAETPATPATSPGSDLR